MCGRGGLDYSWKTVWNYLNISGEVPAGRLTRLNVAPSTTRAGETHWTRIPVVRSAKVDPELRELNELVWPLVPHWARAELPRYSTANCRSEPGRVFSDTVATKPAFRTAWRRSQRCLVPLSWFYEWDPRSKPKQPYRVQPSDGSLLVMAGLWDRSISDGGDSIDSFTIITTEPNQVLRSVGHHRSPVILRQDDFGTWLSGTPRAAEQLLVPPDDEMLVAEKVTRAVNNPGYQGEDLRPPAE